MVDLTPQLASRFAALALGHVTREYPNKLDHVLQTPDDVRGPRALHPDLLRQLRLALVRARLLAAGTLLRKFPALPEAARIVALFDAQLTPEQRRRARSRTSNSRDAATFERPYGWAWLLMLQAELTRHADDAGRRRAQTLAPLARAFAQRFLQHLPYATYPVRAGTHANSAFALALALEYATLCRDDRLFGLARDKARAWFANDADCQAWEPGGEDFLSPALIEAECMRRVLRAPDYAAWLRRFLPRLERGEPAALFAPVDRKRSQRRTNRAPRRSQPEPRMVFSLDRAHARRGRRPARAAAFRSGRARSRKFAARRNGLRGRALARDVCRSRARRGRFRLEGGQTVRAAGCRGSGATRRPD